MKHVLECECPNSAEVTWEKCLNTDYFQRFMNSVLRWIVSWFCNCLADNTAADVFNITTQAERPGKSWLHKDLATLMIPCLTLHPPTNPFWRITPKNLALSSPFPSLLDICHSSWPLSQTLLDAYPVAIIPSHYWGWRYHKLVFLASYTAQRCISLISCHNSAV